MSATFIKLFDSYWKYLSPIAIVAMAYLQTQFVSRTEYQLSAEKVIGRIERIEQLLIRMEANAETDKRHDTQLVDHEGRIRSLEKIK